MVPLRLDVYDACPSPALLSARPALVLKAVSAPPHKTRTRRSPWSRVENLLIAGALAAGVLFFVLSSVLSLAHSVQQSYTSPAQPAVVMLSKTVTRGDTLAKFATRYGNPSTYILEREDQIARTNHLAGTTPLVPGQHLLIPVTNPTLIAQIIRNAPRHLIASR